MKKTPFEKLWTKEFLLKLKKLVLKSQYSFFCTISNTFEVMWNTNSYRKQIKKLANAFLAQHSYNDIFFTDESSRGVLFDSKKGICHNRKEIRLAFLDHEIARLSA